MCGIDYNQFLSVCCQECGDLWWHYRCHTCSTYLCDKCAKVAEYIRTDQNVLGVPTSSRLPSKAKVFLCPKCYKEFDPID